MHHTLLCLLLLWQSGQIFAHPSRGRSSQPRAAAATSYGLTRFKKPLLSSSSTSDLSSPPGQLEDNAERSRYLLPVEVEGQSFFLEIDTGSSDTWIIQDGFDCYKTFDTDTYAFTGTQSEGTCNFGANYSPGSDFEKVPDVFQLSCYGQTESTKRCVAGPLGLVSMSFAGYTVKDQVLGAPSQVCCRFSTIPSFADHESRLTQLREILSNQEFLD